MSKTLQGKYADKLNKQIEELYKVIDAKDKIINEQVLEIARLKSKCEILEENNKLFIQQKQQMYEDLDIAYDKIDKAIEYINKRMVHEGEYWVRKAYHFKNTEYGKDLLEILGDKENE